MNFNQAAILAKRDVAHNKKAGVRALLMQKGYDL